MQQYLEAGKVVTTHGVRGEMKLELWCDGVDFLKKAGRLYPSAQGGKAYNGAKMLLYQGIIAFELWNQVEITEDQAAIVYEKLKETCYGKE